MNGIDAGKLLALLVPMALCGLLAWLGFKNRDIRVAGDGGWKLPWRRKRS